MQIEGYIGTVFEFASIPDLWLESSYNQNGWSFEGETRDGQELSLQTVWNELVPNISLPMELDVKLKDVQLKINIGNATEEKRDYKLEFNASIAAHIKPADGFESELNIEKLHFIYNKSASDEQKTTVAFSVKGNAHVSNFLVVNDCSLDFNYTYSHEKKNSEWNFKGELYVQAFERLLYFTSEVEVLQTEQSFSFLFNAVNAAIHGTYFNKIEGTTSNEILRVLNNGKAPENNQLKIGEIPPDFSSLLENKFTPVQKTAIEKVIEMAKRNNEPLLTIPNLLNNNKPLCTVAPHVFKLKLARKDSKFKSLDFAIGSDLTLYNTWANQTEIFSIKNGILSTGFDVAEKKFYVSYNSDRTTIKPLALISLLPGIQDAIRNAFGETPENQPKTVALLNMMEIQPKGFRFLKKEENYDIDATIRLVLNENLKIVDEDLYAFCEKLFPKSGEERFLEGSLSYSSKEGLLFILRNNNGIEIPNLFAIISESLDADFKENFRQNTGITIDAALDIGESFVLLDQVRFKLAKDIQMDMRIAVGLPSKLNDRFFNPASKLHGLINCYDRDKFVKNQPKNNKNEYEIPVPKDGLLRATLKFGTAGVSGQLDQFNIFNLEKIAEEFEGFITEKNDSIVLDINALTPENNGEYGKLELEKIKFKLDFKKSAFAISGGVQILSDSFKIPVSPVLKKLISLVPPDSIDTKTLHKIAGMCTDSIALKSMNFYNAETQQLSIDEMLAFFRQFLLKQHQELELLPKEFINVINAVSKEISALLPEKFLEYLSIDIPPGFAFKLEINTDQSFCLDFEVSEPTEAQRAAGFSEHLQILIPDITMPPVGIYGVRLKKIGLGTALFNQAIRLDLSGELANFKYLDLIAGAGYELIRKTNREDKKLQHVLPNVKQFAINYKIENLIMFIFPQTTVPIPVPIFYDEFACYGAGFDGTVTDFSIKFPKPELNIKKALAALGNLKTFFSEKDAILPITNYGNNNPNSERGLLPNFSAGPITVELPGILGSEKGANGEKNKITLGFKDVITFNPKDLVALVANTTKFGIQSIVDGKKYLIKINEEQSELPINYLVKYMPLSQRIGSKKISFLELFEGEFIWILCAPDEFVPYAIPDLIKAEEEKNNTISTLKCMPDEIAKMIPYASEWTSEHQGLVTAIKGRIEVGSVLKMNAILISAITDSHGLYTGMLLNTQIANLLNMTLKSDLQVTPKEAHKFQMKGAATITILDDIPVVDGSFILGIGEKSIFHVSGMIDLFPFENSPVKLYTGTSKGTKANITGIINENGIVLGHIKEDGTVEAAGIQLEIGDLHIGGTTRILNTADKGAWEINLNIQDTIMSLQAGYQKIENGKQMSFGISTNKAIDFFGIIHIANIAGDKGPNGNLMLQYTNGTLIPRLEEFYLDASVRVLGFSAAAKIEIDATKFKTNISANLGIITAELNIEGSNLNDIGTFHVNGKLGLLNDAIKATLQTSFYNDGHQIGFKGTSTLEILGKTYSDWEINASVNNHDPKFIIEGALDLFHIPNVFHLHSGNPNLTDKLKGSISKEGLHISGGMQLHFGLAHLVGTTVIDVKSNNEYTFKTDLKFNSGLLFSNMVFSLNLSRENNILALDGHTSGTIIFIPNVLELSTANTVTIRVNEATNNVVIFKANGSTNIFGIATNYDIFIEKEVFKFETTVNLPLLDISIHGKSSDVSDINKMLFSGSIDLTKLNAEIDRLYGGLINNVQAKLDAAAAEVRTIQSKQGECNEQIRILNLERQEKERKLREIRRIHDRWKGNFTDPGAGSSNFNFCVPPPGHVEYWHRNKVWIPFHPSFGYPRYSWGDLVEVRRYYQYIRDLNLNIKEPTSEFGAEAKRLFNAVAGILNQAFTDIANGITNAIRDVGNAIHHVISKEILDKLNIDTSSLDAINRTFNDGVRLVQEGAKKWSELNTKLLSNKPFEVLNITYKDQSVNIFQTKVVTATMTFKILGDKQSPLTVELNLENPVQGITNTIKQLMPSELQQLM